MARDIFSEWEETRRLAITSWVINPEAMGRSSTAVMGIGTSLSRRGSEWRVAKCSEMQEIWAPLSTRVYVLMGFLESGNANVTEMRKWDGE